MKVGISIWNGRVSPVFDTAGTLLLVQTNDRAILSERQECLAEKPVAQRMALLQSLGVDTLICGAISQPLAEMISSAGIGLVAFVAGDVREVLEAFLNGTLSRPVFAMPGCCASGRRRRGCGGSQQDGGEMMSPGKGGGRGGGRGQYGGGGAGDGGRGMGRMGGPQAVGVGGVCVCPQCTEQVQHQRGVPCTEMKCPKCGTALIRQEV